MLQPTAATTYNLKATSYNEDIFGSMISEAGSVEAMMRSPAGFPSFVHSPAATLDHTKVRAGQCLLSLNLV